MDLKCGAILSTSEDEVEAFTIENGFKKKICLTIEFTFDKLFT